MVDFSIPALILAAFAGGAFGAALGALPAFIFTGFMVIAGEAANLISEDIAAEVSGLTANEVGAGITGSIAFGPVFGPHIAFAGGAAAAAYSAKKGYMDTGFDYHEAKNIAFAQGTKPDVLIVGGLFGILGWGITYVSATLFSAPWDPIAIGVVLSAIAHRLAFGYSIIGKVRGSGLLDMTPFEREERRTPSGTSETVTDGEVATDGGTAATGRFATEPWLPHQYIWTNVAVLGLVAGLLGGFTALATGSAFLAFGISAASLVFLNCGVEQIPVTHHITLPASTAALAVTASGEGVDASAALVGSGLTTGLLVAGLFGIICALFGEAFQRVFYAHGDTHVDPPAAAIVFGTFLIAVLAIAGVFGTTVWVPLPV
jgi:hypothetical protein